MVILICVDGYMPPIGAIGVVVSGIDWAGGFADYDVFFPTCPCPVGEITWCIPPSFMVKIRGSAIASTTARLMNHTVT